MADKKYIVVNQPVVRTTADEQDDGRIVTGSETYEVGEEIEPSDAELKAFPDRFEEADDTDRENAETNAQGNAERTRVPQETADERTDDNSDAEYTAAELNAMSYSELREVAKEYDNVPGNITEYEMRLKLKQEMGHADESTDTSDFGGTAAEPDEDAGDADAESEEGGIAEAEDADDESADESEDADESEE